MWGASFGVQHNGDILIVSSRAPGWGASALDFLRCSSHGGFKSCPRVGGILYPQAENIAPVKVSSRAPVWGASFICLPRTVIRAVSSRAPVWGASEFLEGTTAAGKFQVVPPCGGHLEMAPNVIVRHLVSSRAPVWGASKNNGIPSRRCGFKSCPRVGGIL